MVMGIAVIPVTGLIGATVDFSRVSEIHSTYQSAADAAVLAAATSGLSTLAQKQNLADEVFRTHAPEGSHRIGQITLSESELGLHIRAAGQMDTTLLSVMGIDAVDIGVEAVAQGASAPLEIAFVIDATNSMTFGSRWTTAYDSLDRMLESLDGASAGPEDLRVTVIPMGDMVNIGEQNAGWIETFQMGDLHNYTDAEYEAFRAYDTDNDASDWELDQDDWSGCVFAREQPTMANPYRLTDVRANVETFIPHDPDQEYGVHGLRSLRCPVPIIGPSEDMRQIMRDVADIRPAGTGRFDEGMAWAWRSLSVNWRNDWGIAGYPRSTEDVRKIIVFITDGNSTFEVRFFDGHDEYGHNNAGVEMLSNLVAVCESAKASGIEVVTFFIEGNRHAEKYMQDCATSSSHFFDVTRNVDMEDAFSTLGSRLQEARLVR